MLTAGGKEAPRPRPASPRQARPGLRNQVNPEKVVFPGSLSDRPVETQGERGGHALRLGGRNSKDRLLGPRARGPAGLRALLPVPLFCPSVTDSTPTEPRALFPGCSPGRALGASEN